MTAKTKFFLFALVLWLPSAKAQELVIALNHVSIDRADCIKAPSSQLQFACHRLKPGSGFVVAQRKYWPPKATDDDAFEKLTIFFPTKPQKGQVITLPSQGATAFFSSGPSSFPGKQGCYGFAKSGYISVEDVTDSKVVLRVNIDFDLKSPLGWGSACRRGLVNKRYIASYFEYKNLTPWLGLKRPEVDIWSESHP